MRLPLQKCHITQEIVQYQDEECAVYLGRALLQVQSFSGLQLDSGESIVFFLRCAMVTEEKALYHLLALLSLLPARDSLRISRGDSPFVTSRWLARVDLQTTKQFAISQMS